MPRGAHIIGVHAQNEVPVIWAEVDPNAPADETRTFAIVGTGQPLPDVAHEHDRYHHGTALLYAGTFVLHVYEVRL